MSGSPSDPRLTTDVTPRLLVALSLALIPAFALTTVVTQAYRAEQRRLAAEWFDRGNQALDSGEPEDAIAAFRTALTFSREDRLFRLRLAQALAADGRTAEARAYLLTLRDAQPGNGPVNLELARLAVASGDAPQATRFYHAAIEGAWTDTAEAQRRAIRLEFARYLLASGAELSAQSELLALADDLPPDPEFRRQVAALMLDARLAERALSIYEPMLKANPRDGRALAGAGRAAFETGNYTSAEALLSRALNAGADDPQAAAALETVRLIAALDPHRRRLPLRTRAARAMQALDVARARLDACEASRNNPRLSELAGAIDGHRSTLDTASTRDLEAIEAAMDVVFQIERLASTLCGEPHGADRALLLLAEQRRGGAP